MSLHEQLEEYTVLDYRQWQGDWELIQGRPVAMTPSPGFLHQRVSLQIARQLDEQLEDCPQCVCVFETDWHVATYTVVRPDIIVLCGQVQEKVSHRPECIVEVVSESTARMDERIKFQLYAEEGVPYYLLVYPNQKKTKIFVSQDGRYRKVDDVGYGKWEFTIRECSGVLDFTRIWTRMP